MSEGLLPQPGQQPYNAPTEAAAATMLLGLSPEGPSHARQLIDAAADAAIADLSAFTGIQKAQPAGEQRGLQAELLLQAAGIEDPEYQLDKTGLQHSLMSIFDSAHLDRLSEQLLRAERWDDAGRFQKLRDPSVSHDWFWRLNPAHGPHAPDRIT